MDPDAGVLFLLGRGLSASGRCADAIPAFEKALASNARLGAARQGLAECLAATGRAREAARALGGPGTGTLEDQWRRLCHASGAPAADRVRSCVLSGESDRALEALREGERSGSPFLAFVAEDPLFAPLAARDGFRSVLDEASPRRE